MMHNSHHKMVIVAVIHMFIITLKLQFSLLPVDWDQRSAWVFEKAIRY